VNRVMWVAWREFGATVFTKAFALGIFLPPLMIALVTYVLPRISSNKAPAVVGHIAVIDQSGVVAERFERAFTPEAMKKRQGEQDPAAQAAAAAAAAAGGSVPGMNEEPPRLRVLRLDPDTKPDDAKEAIRAGEGKEKDAKGEDPRLALVVIPASAVTPAKPNEYGTFDLFVTPRLDMRVQGDIENQAQRAIVDARIEANHLAVADIRAMTARPDAREFSVTAAGDQASGAADKVAKMLVPGGFMFLIYISVMVCGTGLMMSTIEEKSSRVMELVLSAVTPMQLLIGKLAGQMAVGLLLVGVYAATGMAALVMFSLMSSIDPMNLVWLAIYFVIGFGMMAGLYAAVGSAVNDIREAQALQAPLQIIMFLPIAVWFGIMSNPNSTFAQVASFVPPVSPFVMVLRLAGNEKIPTWQIGASIAVGFLFVGLFLWGAAKIFRIGVLMYGKPPDFGTLIKWIRMA
jgi:ABC-2 type transport system permease protein